MSDMQTLLATCARHECAGEEVVLATVVKVEGSAYRRPGARMLISPLGSTSGTISGGCLESAVAKKAWWLTERGQPVVQKYSSAAGDDEEDGLFGLGCNGTLHLMLERHSPGKPAAAIGLLREVLEQGRAGALARLIACPSSGALKLGQHLAFTPGGDWRGNVPHAGLSACLQEALRQTLDDGRSTVQRYQVEGQEVEVLLEYLAPPRRLLIFGAGHDAVPVVAMAKLMGWQVTVIDSRAHFARAERFAQADAVHCIELEQVQDWAPMVDGAAVLVMSHSYRQDRHWLGAVLGCRPAYIGQLGPRSRTERLLAELLETGVEPPGLAALRYPLGLDIGGDTPQSVALAAIAEITAQFNGREGGRLQARSGTIHGRDQAQPPRVVSRELSRQVVG